VVVDQNGVIKGLRHNLPGRVAALLFNQDQRTVRRNRQEADWPPVSSCCPMIIHWPEGVELSMDIEQMIYEA
jgi:hypothetical protein